MEFVYNFLGMECLTRRLYCYAFKQFAIAAYTVFNLPQGKKKLQLTVCIIFVDSGHVEHRISSSQLADSISLA